MKFRTLSALLPALALTLTAAARAEDRPERGDSPPKKEARGEQPQREGERGEERREGPRAPEQRNAEARHREAHSAVERVVGPEKARELHELFERTRQEMRESGRPGPEMIEEMRRRVERIVGPEKARELREAMHERFGPPTAGPRRPDAPEGREPGRREEPRREGDAREGEQRNADRGPPEHRDAVRASVRPEGDRRGPPGPDAPGRPGPGGMAKQDGPRRPTHVAESDDHHPKHDEHAHHHEHAHHDGQARPGDHAHHKHAKCEACEAAKADGCKHCAKQAKRDHKVGKHGPHGGPQHARHDSAKHHHKAMKKHAAAMHARLGHRPPAPGQRPEHGARPGGDDEHRHASVPPSRRVGPSVGRPGVGPGPAAMHGFIGPHGAGRPGMPGFGGERRGGEGPGGAADKLEEVSKKLDRLIAAVEQLSRSLKK